MFRISVVVIETCLKYEGDEKEVFGSSGLFI